MKREYFVSCTLGLEDVLTRELQDLGATAVESRKGGAWFEAEQRTAYAANLWLRSAIRVQELLLEAPASDPQSLYLAVQSVDWAQYLTPEHTFAIDASVRNSRITHSGYAALKTKDAIVDQLRDRFGVRPSVNVKQPDVPLKLVIQRDEMLLYRDLSGDSLHKRGWRPIQVKSPLNEATAAGLLLLSGWDARTPLVDPMCGSGTLLIEAACIAADQAPGIQRAFAFERWPDFDEALWKELREEAHSRVRRTPSVELLGSDAHSGALAIARQSADRAGVAHWMQFIHSPVRTLEPRTRPGMVVVNPPYGERLGEGEELTRTWRDLGAFLHRHCRGATAFVLSGNPELPRLLGLKASRKHVVMNGPIECRWLRYEILPAARQSA